MNYTKEYFDFDLDRKNTRSMKWDDCNSKFGVDESTAMIPMWIADMEFQIPKRSDRRSNRPRQSWMLWLYNKTRLFL